MFTRRALVIMVGCASGLLIAACSAGPPPVPTTPPKAEKAAPTAAPAAAPTAASKAAPTPTTALVPKASTKEESNTVRFGVIASYFAAPAVIAMQEKLFEREGTKVEYQPFTLGRNAAQALVAGSLDVAVLGSQPLITTASNSDIVSIGVTSYTGKAQSLVVRKDSDVKTLADLKGKRIAMATGSTTYGVLVRKAFPKYGLKEGDIQVVNMDTATLMSALSTGSVDAFATGDPYPVLAEVEGIGRILLDFDFDPYPSFYGAHRSFVEANPTTTTKFLMGAFQGNRLMMEDTARASKIMREFMASIKVDFTPEVADRLIKRQDPVPFYRPDLADYLKEMAEPEIKAGNIKAMPQWERVLLTDSLEKAAAATGLKNPFR